MFGITKHDDGQEKVGERGGEPLAARGHRSLARPDRGGGGREQGDGVSPLEK